MSVVIRSAMRALFAVAVVVGAMLACVAIVELAS